MLSSSIITQHFGQSPSKCRPASLYRFPKSSICRLCRRNPSHGSELECRSRWQQREIWWSKLKFAAIFSKKSNILGWNSFGASSSNKFRPSVCRTDETGSWWYSMLGWAVSRASLILVDIRDVLLFHLIAFLHAGLVTVPPKFKTTKNCVTRRFTNSIRYAFHLNEISYYSKWVYGNITIVQKCLLQEIKPH